MARNTTQLIYQAIRIEGGLIPAAELARLTTLQTPDQTEQTDSHYRIPKGLKLRDEVARFWKIGQGLWSDFQSSRQRTDVDAHQTTARNFLAPLLRDVLGFADLEAGATVDVSGHRYDVGYAARRGSVPMVLAGYDHALDAPAERFGELNEDTGKTRRRSPFMLAQEALNASDQSLWAITCNGLTLRILRDNPSLTRPAYVEVDLESIFSEDLYADFTAFWLLAHASRFGAVGTEPTDCPWERWRIAGQEVGVTVRLNLRYQVAEALRALGTGFLSHPENGSLRASLIGQGESLGLSKQAFFEELLRLVYRLIFLATVEDRVDASTGQSLVFSPNASKEAKGRYRAGYSITWLRDRAVRRSGFDTHSDLWQALSITFDGLAQGQSALGLPALGGLYGADQCPNLATAHIENRHLLSAIFQLGYFRQATGLTRVNYRDMGPEELGSVYESLLELVPDIQSLGQPHAAKLAFVGDDDINASTQGNTRKLTGSYYTPDSLVQELIKSALEPVIRQTVQDNPANPVNALLQLTVCDPACGSGHFLLAAARRLADEVATLRAMQNGGVPSPVDYRHALREVVGHCIYGVDKNPMAIQLAKTALWLEAYTPDRPLTFIDHHLQVGDALLGVLDPKILENGIPDEAYAVLSGDDKAVASALKKQNKADLKSWKAIAASDLFAASPFTVEANAVEQLADDTLVGIAAKRSAWATAASRARHSTLARLADTYVAAFLAPKVADAQESIPLSGYLWALLRGQGVVNADIDSAADHICRTHSVFHWWLAFPQVAAKGGFSVMLGNPPWERIKLQEEEFFATRSPLVAAAKNKAERGKRIELLRHGLLLHTLYPDVEAAEGLSPPNRAEMQLYMEFLMARRGAEAASLYAHDSGRFPLTGVGDVNTYALFAESFFQAISSSGRAGFIIPSGIATDDSTKHFFGALVKSERLVSLFSCYEIRRWFPDTDDRKSFCMFTLGSSDSASFMYDIDSLSDLSVPDKHYELTNSEFRLLNPNTLTLPIFRSRRDAELTKKIYRDVPVLIADATSEDGSSPNPWGISFQRMLDMSNDSGLFQDDPAVPDAPRRLPLYEAKMIHQFDHRWATYVDAPEKPDGLDTQNVSKAQKSDPAFTVSPRYWVKETDVLARIARVPSRVAKAWMSWRNAEVHATDSHTAEARQTLSNSRDALTLTLAGWVAGALFLRAVAVQSSNPTSAPQPHSQTANLFDDAPSEPAPAAEPAQPWSYKTAMAATQVVERQLANQYANLWEKLKEANVVGQKAFSAFPKWALQDDPAQGLGLRDSELDELIGLQVPHQPIAFDIDSRATTVHSKRSTGQFASNFSWLDVWMDRRSPRWLMGWRDICRSTDERTVIASLLPRMGVGHKMPVIRFPDTVSGAQSALLYGNLCSMTLDYIARQKVGGSSLTYHYLKQFPVLPPNRYTEADLIYIVPRVLELTHTTHDMQPWADDLVSYDPRPADQRDVPFPWDPERRAQLRAELDAYYARLYCLTRDELRYILDPADVMGDDYPSETFRVLKNSEMRAYGEYRTQRLVLAAWDRLAAAEVTLQGVTDVSLPIYLEQGVISSPQEGDFAGLIVALIQNSVDGIAIFELEDVVAHSTLAHAYLDSTDAARLSSLLASMALLAGHVALASISPIVQRLESVGAVSRTHSFGKSRFFSGTNAVPSDVMSRPEHAEMAQLMLKLEVSRATSRGNDDDESQPGQRSQGAF